MTTRDTPPDVHIDLVALERTTGRSIASFRDASTGTTVEVHARGESPGPWREYLDGARQAYEPHGIEFLVDADALTSDPTTSLFFLLRDEEGVPVGGLRAHGPHTRSAEVHALRELARHPRIADIGRTVADRLPDGIVELKGGWAHPTRHRQGLSEIIARCHVHAMTLLGARYAICTCWERTAPRWAVSGGRETPGLGTTAYPDDRYQSTLLWWDASDPAGAGRDQQEAISLERRALLGATVLAGAAS